jgi:histidine triad (HIT) family protein
MVQSLPPFLRNIITDLLRIYYNMSDCVFCKILNNEAPGIIVYRDDQVTAFRDSHPAASTHILIVPNRHIDSVNALTPEDEPLIGHLYTVARLLAAQEGIAEGGYRLITNTGRHGGQTVFHLHMHLLGGGQMKHPMG